MCRGDPPGRPCRFLPAAQFPESDRPPAARPDVVPFAHDRRELQTRDLDPAQQGRDSSGGVRGESGVAALVPAIAADIRICSSSRVGAIWWTVDETCSAAYQHNRIAAATSSTRSRPLRTRFLVVRSGRAATWLSRSARILSRANCRPTLPSTVSTRTSRSGGRCSHHRSTTSLKRRTC